MERFDDAHGSDRLASFIWERLEGGADGEVVNQLFEATGELGLNVVEHAGSPAGGFDAAQRYKAGMPEERIIVAVGDVGVGIRDSLLPRYGDMTDGEAIERAIQWYVSRIPDEGRGQGSRVWSTLIAPKLVSSRHQARELTAGLAGEGAPGRTVELARRAAQNRGCSTAWRPADEELAGQLWRASRSCSSSQPR